MQFFKKTKKKFAKVGDKAAECILIGLLACFDAVGPVWNFLFVKERNPDESIATSNKIRWGVMKPIILLFENFGVYSRIKFSSKKL